MTFTYEDVGKDVEFTEEIRETVGGTTCVFAKKGGLGQLVGVNEATGRVVVYVRGQPFTGMLDVPTDVIKIKERTFNEALATGRAYVNYDPVDVLKELRAAVSWSNGRYLIDLGKDHESYVFKRLNDCIAFNSGH